MKTIVPYWGGESWVFDDESVGLVREPFVYGMSEMISFLVAGIPNARQGFLLTFSDRPFSGYQWELVWEGEELGGNWYKLGGSWPGLDVPVSELVSIRGWLCSALFRYFDKVPERLYVAASEKKKGAVG